MKIKHILAFALVCQIPAPLIAQNLEREDGAPGLSDEVQKAIAEFNRKKSSGKNEPNEVTVVLEPPAPVAIVIPEEEIPSPDEVKKPILVSGKPRPAAALQTGEAPADPAIPEPGLEVRVESIRSGTGTIDPDQVSLSASFPAKPLSKTPDHWFLEKSELAPAFKRDVELQPGVTISLNIQPHVLSAQADGAETFSVSEPGFDPALGYRQPSTVGAILGQSIAQLDEDSKQLGAILSDLDRLLSSLPQPEPEIQPEPVRKK